MSLEDKLMEKVKLRKIDVTPTPMYKRIGWFLLFAFVIIYNGGSAIGHNEYDGTVVKLETSEGYRGRTDRDMIVRLDSGKKIELANDNSILRLKRNAAALQKQVEVGRTYHFETFGMFEHNIAKIEDVANE
jgi:hypothetical protein